MTETTRIGWVGWVDWVDGRGMDSDEERENTVDVVRVNSVDMSPTNKPSVRSSVHPHEHVRSVKRQKNYTYWRYLLS